MFDLIAKFLIKQPERKLSRHQREIEDYLSQSVDRVDFERRERELARRGYLK